MSLLIRITAVIAFAISLTGCSSGPSDAEVKAALQAENGQGFIEISDIERINGYENGDNRYVVEVRYTTTFLKSFEEVSSTATGLEKFALGAFTMFVGEWDKGDSFEEQQSLAFIDSENGWILE